MKDYGLIRRKKEPTAKRNGQYQFTGTGYLYWTLGTAGPPGIEKLTAKRYKQYSRKLTQWAQDAIKSSPHEKSFALKSGFKNIPLHRNPLVLSQILDFYREELVAQKDQLKERRKKHAFLSPNYEKLGQIVHRLNLWISVVKHTADELRTQGLPIY